MEDHNQTAIALLTEFGHYVVAIQTKLEEAGNPIANLNMSSMAFEFLRNKALYELAVSTINDFGAMPVEFEFNDSLYDFGDIVNLLTDEQHKNLSAMIEANA